MGLAGLTKHKSLTFLSLPFITNFFIKDRSFAVVASFLFVFLVIDAFVFSKIKNKLMLLALFTFLSVFLYSFILYFDTQHVIHDLRFRHFLVMLFLFFLFVFITVIYYRLYQFVNVFLLFFSLSFFLTIDSEQYNRSVLLNNLNFKPLQKD